MGSDWSRFGIQGQGFLNRVPAWLAPGALGVASTETFGWIQKVDPPWGSMTYTIGVLDSRIGGSTFWILPGVWEAGTLASRQELQHCLRTEPGWAEGTCFRRQQHMSLRESFSPWFHLDVWHATSRVPPNLFLA